MSKLRPFLLCAMAVLWIDAIQPAGAQQSSDVFTYHSPGVMAHEGDPGVRDRRVFFPTMKFPIRVGPEAAGDGKPLRAFANSQVFRQGLDDGNDPRLYVFPWTDTLCESKHVGGSMPVCPNSQHRGHQGIDIRPHAPKNNTFDVLAWADGIAMNISSTGLTQVRIRDAENNGKACLYLHLRPLATLKPGDQVRKGDVIGKVSNVMPPSGTSIHLHIQCTANHPDIRQSINMPIYTSLIAAYRRDWQLPDMIESGALLRDPEREIEQGGPLPVQDPGCSEPLGSAIEQTKDRPFKARYKHNCSEMGLTLDTATQNMEIVYVRPKQSLQQSAQRNPVLVSGKLAATGGAFTGQAINFNSACSDPKFNVAGKVDFTDTEITLEGDRQPLGQGCNPSGSPQHESLRFTTLVTPSPPPPDNIKPGELNCPFALPPGQLPVVTDGREIPPKSERSCNFTALTVPGGITFAQMPRYLREWPGVRQELLTDAFHDQIITFQTAETGVGAWWYWLTQRAVNGPNLTKQGFTKNGKPTLTEVARAIAGKGRSDDFVRTKYLSPYLRFGSEFFGRTMTETDQLDLSTPDVRWNLARTMFRLESGRTPKVDRKQFDCGIQLGTDVSTDFDRANVETVSSGQVPFQAFKGLASYITCSGGGGPTDPGLPGNIANLEQANQKIKELESSLTGLRQNLADRDQKIQLASLQISELQIRIKQLTGGTTPPTPNPPDTTPVPSDTTLQTHIAALKRELELTTQMLSLQQELCKLNQFFCKPN